MGVILAIAFDVASSNGGWASLESSASLLLAALTSLGLWLWGRPRAQFAAGADGREVTPGFAEGVARRLAWRLRLWPASPSPAPAPAVSPRSSTRAPSPDRMRARPRAPDPAASSSPLRAPPGAPPDSQQPPHEPAQGSPGARLMMR